MGLNIWLIKPYDSRIKSPLDIRLTGRVLKHALKWARLSWGKYRVKSNGKKVLYTAYASAFKANGVVKHHISLDKMSSSFMTFVRSGIEDLMVRKQEEIDRSGNRRSFESTLFSIPQPGLDAFDLSEYGSELRSIVHDIVGTDAKLRNIQLHVNIPGETFSVFSQGNSAIPESPHFGFHADNNINTVKAMVYLEIKDGDGAFQYLRGSQKFTDLVSFSLKKANRHLGLHLNSAEALRQIMSIPWFMRAKSEISSFADDTKIARLVYQNDCKIDASVGDTVIFDPVGLHKGGLVQKHRRVALQLVYSAENSLWSI